MKAENTSNQILREQKCYAYDLKKNSTIKRVLEVNFWGQILPVYANANLSVYSAQQCNAKCALCVEELKTASRGTDLLRQKKLKLILLYILKI
jgi:cyclic pyranopterin phosphate synthase